MDVWVDERIKELMNWSHFVETTGGWIVVTMTNLLWLKIELLQHLSQLTRFNYVYIIICVGSIRSNLAYHGQMWY